MEIIIMIGLTFIVIIQFVLIYGVKKKFNDDLQKVKMEINQTNQNQMNALAKFLNDSQKVTNDMQNSRLLDLNTNLSSRQDTLMKNVSEMTRQLDIRIYKMGEISTSNNELIRRQLNETGEKLEMKVKELTNQNAVSLEAMRLTFETKMQKLQEENAQKLEEMRQTVDEKLQDTLEKRISKSFQLVSERLEQVYKGLGEMQHLANGVGDLKKVLSNVKTRGILGEIQLGAILEEILSPEQYEQNVATKKGSRNVVEYAVKLPGENDKAVYLPIDAKFNGDTYAKLMDAYESNDQNEIALAKKTLENAIKLNAKDIHDKYIDSPNTTEFAIMFLPFEGLYAEVVRLGMIEKLQKEYKINIAGPTTMAALLNSLQMGFKTLAIQKRSSEVWDVLGAVKTEFDKFGKVLENTQNRLELAQKELDNLVGVRTRQIQKRLNNVTSLEDVRSIEILEEEM